MNAPEGGLYRPLVWSLAVLFVASGALLSVQMISSVVGPFRLAEIGASDPRGVVALWRPRQAPAGITLRTRLGHELVESGRALREVTSLGALDPARVGAIVLSEPRRIDDAQLADLTRYLEAGGGAVLIGSIAVRDADDGWLGWDEMGALLGGRVVPLEQGSAGAIVAARRGPVSAALLPRQRVGIRPDPGLPGVRIADAELRWAGDRLDGEAPAAAVRLARGRGRLAWLAVDPEHAAASDADRIRLRRVLEAAVAWVSRTASLELLAWPGGALFASVVERDGASGAPEDLASLEAEWRRQIDAARADGGLARLRLPESFAHGGQAERALARSFGEVARAHGWTATRRELSAWTRTRAAVDASLRRAGPRRLIVEVTNRGVATAGDLVLRVHLNEPALAARAEATQLFRPDAPVRLTPGGETVDLVLPPLDPRASAAYSLDYEPAPQREG